MYYALDISEVNNNMDTTTMRMLVSILKESQLYMSMTHEERIAILFSLLKEYPFLGNSQN